VAETLRIEQRGQSFALLCACCDLPFARMQFGRLVIQSRHHGDEHTNALDLEELQSILELIRQDSAKMPIAQTQ
jgi:hypothetical protein